jgi:hypothetical protein
MQLFISSSFVSHEVAVMSTPIFSWEKRLPSLHGIDTPACDSKLTRSMTLTTQICGPIKPNNAGDDDIYILDAYLRTGGSS